MLKASVSGNLSVESGIPDKFVVFSSPEKNFSRKNSTFKKLSLYKNLNLISYSLTSHKHIISN